MAKRRKKVHKKARKVVRRKAVKRKAGPPKSKGVAYNRAAQWKAYRELQMRADKAWEKFRKDVRKKARSDILIRDQNHLRLLLGECNYMARECMRMADKLKKRRK